MISIFKYICIGMSALCIMPVFGANPQIVKLLREKQQKYARLEQCTKKVNGFKIAGISTLGLTAAGIGGNIALASKNKQLDKEINGSDGLKAKIEKEEEKLAKTNDEIATEKLKIQQKQEKLIEAEQQETTKAEQTKGSDEQGKEEVQENKKVTGNEYFVSAEGIRYKSLDDCPGNAFSKLQEYCPECANDIVREQLCSYDTDESHGVFGFETDILGPNTWCYYKQNEYSYAAVMMDDCVCAKIQELERAKKQNNKK